MRMFSFLFFLHAELKNGWMEKLYRNISGANITPRSIITFAQISNNKYKEGGRGAHTDVDNEVTDYYY